MRIVKLDGKTAIKVVKSQSIHYCGRGCAGLSASNLANPYVVGKHGTKEEVLLLYTKWLIKRLADDHEVWTELRSLSSGSILGCWCVDKPIAGVKPYVCHCDIIAMAWENTC